MTRVEMNRGFPQGLVSEMNECGERTPFLKPSVAGSQRNRTRCNCRRQHNAPASSLRFQQASSNSKYRRRWKGHCWRRRMLERHSSASSAAIRASPLRASALASGISALSPRTSSSSQIERCWRNVPLMQPRSPGLVPAHRAGLNERLRLLQRASRWAPYR